MDGNAQSLTATFNLAGDTTAPIVTLVNPANGSSTSDTTPTFSGVAGNLTGDSTTVTVRIYSGPTATGSPVQTLNAIRSGTAYTIDAAALAQGQYTAQASQSDTAGNTGTSSANTFIVDTTAPIVTLVNPANGSSTSDTTPTFSGVAGNLTGDSTTVTVRIYSGPTATGSPVQTLNAIRSGTAYTIDAAVTRPGPVHGPGQPVRYCRQHRHELGQHVHRRHRPHRS